MTFTLGQDPIKDDPFYTEKLRFYQGGGARELIDLPEYQEALWDKFCLVYAENNEGILLDHDVSTSTKKIRTNFLRFIQRYTLLHITLETLQSENELPAAGGNLDFYLDYLNAFYGKHTIVERTDLWNRFLHLQNLETNPTLDTSELQVAFASYINGMRMSELRMEATTALSPKEAESRYILNAVMDSVGTMLTTVEDLIKTQAKLLTFFGKKREAYTKMMTRVPNLVPIEDIYTSVDTTVQLPHLREDIPPEEIEDAIQNWDLQEFTFGYNKINLKDVIEWGFSTAMKDPGANNWIEFAGEGDPPESGQFQFRATKNAQGNLSELAVRFQYPGHTEWTERTLALLDDDGNTILKKDEFDRFHPKPFSDWVEEIEDLFKEIFIELSAITEDVPGFIPYYNEDFSRIVEGVADPVDSRRLGLRGRFLFSDYETDDEILEQITQENFKDRATQNAVLQQYVEGIRSLRKLVSDRSKELQVTLAEAKQGVNKITGLWTVILEMINNVTKAIFKQK